MRPSGQGARPRRGETIRAKIGEEQSGRKNLRYDVQQTTGAGEFEEASVEKSIEEIIGGFATARGRHCLVAILPHLDRSLLPGFFEAMDELPPGEPIDVVLASHGGCIDTAYVIARALGRRRAPVTIYVPICAKSAATLIALVGDDLVLGAMGELGPLDAQFDHKRSADTSINCSVLSTFKAFEQSAGISVELFASALSRVQAETGMSPFDASSRAAELTGNLMGRVYEQVDPVKIAESARALEVATHFGVRLLTRYRAGFSHEQAKALFRSLAHDYPCHGFPLDLEELSELGVPARAGHEEEAHLLDRIGRLLLPIEGQFRALGVIEPEQAQHAEIEEVRAEDTAAEDTGAEETGAEEPETAESGCATEESTQPDMGVDAAGAPALRQEQAQEQVFSQA